MSKLFKINGKDLLNGLLAVLICAILLSIKKAFDNHGLSFTVEDLRGIAEDAISAGLTFLVTIFCVDENGKPLGGVKKRLGIGV